MLSRQLRRFAAFAELSPGDLAAAVAHAQALSLPAGRWLVRPGRELTGSYFLSRGRVRLYQPDEQVDEGSVRARYSLYPGARGVVTLSAVELLHVDTESLAGLFGATSELALPLYESTWLTDGWESRFLGTHIMQRLQPQHWQRILRGMRPVALCAGERIVGEGEPGHEFYVVRAGSAAVHANGRCVAHLQPGDFFGEDALITGGRRNATVTMATSGSVMALSESLFHSDLLPLTLASRTAPGSLVDIDVGIRIDVEIAAPGRTSLHVPLGELRRRLAELPRASAYRVVGGSRSQRVLAAFILTQRGFRIAAVVEDCP
jgi:CRP-like cAMP-binding protein